MKLATFLLLITVMTVSAGTLAQKITLNAKNASLQHVLKDIHNQSGYDFFYNDDLIIKSRPVTVKLDNADLEQTMKAVLNGQPIAYEVDEKAILLKVKEVTQAPVNSALIDITGRVIDEQGKPMPGVTVRVKNGSKATITSSDGSFTLKGAEETATITFFFIGYTTKEQKASEPVWQIQMVPSMSKLDEIQVQAYGLTSRRLSTGDIGTVKAADIAKQPVTSPLEALQGRIAGVEIKQFTGMPGSSFKVEIRGQGSIANGTEPLYVVDGVPYTTDLLLTQGDNLFGTSGNRTAGSTLNYLNLNNIESIDVLKDADATAIYGSRGANGVVLITTKRGKVGPMRVSLSASSGIMKVGHKLDLMNTQQFRQMRKEALANDGKTPDVNNAYDLLLYDSTRYVDWQDRIIGNTAKFSNAQIAISGGSLNTQYNISAVYNRRTTVFETASRDENKGINFNISSSSPDSKFNILLSGGFLLNRSSLPDTDPTGSVYLPPNSPEMVNADGSLNFSNIPNNYMASLRRTFSRSVNNLTTNAVLSYRIIPGLELKANLGYNNLILTEINSSPSSSVNPAYLSFIRRRSAFTDNKSSSWLAEPQLNYSRIFGKHQLNFLIGSNFQSSTATSQILTGEGYTNDNQLLNPQAAPELNVMYDTYDYRYAALFGRLTYNYDDRYIINLTARRDGSSRFGPELRFSNFGAVGLGWIFSKENFLADALPWLSFGKLRASYGITGNDQIGNYRYMNLYSTYYSTYQDIKGLQIENLANPELAWEKNNKFELGTDLGLLKDRITLSVSYFRNRSSNQLLDYPISGVTGFGHIDRNFDAVVQNSGLEFTLTSKNLTGSHFSWTTSANLTIRRNKLVAYPGIATSAYRNSLIVGEPISMARYYDYAGVNPTTGIYEFFKADGSRTSTPSYFTDRTVIYNLVPKFTGGITNSFTFGAFDLDFTLQFAKQSGIAVPANSPGYSTNQLVQYIDSWHKPGDIATYQQYSATYGTPANNAYQFYTVSSGVIQDASFIRLRNLSLGYSLPEKLIQKIGLKQGRFYLQGQNLYTLTSYKGFDPENLLAFNLPPLMTLTCGVQITF